jgi:hypothetical protein
VAIEPGLEYSAVELRQFSFVTSQLTLAAVTRAVDDVHNRSVGQ